jgi:hypothetical protein
MEAFSLGWIVSIRPKVTFRALESGPSTFEFTGLARLAATGPVE